MIMVASQFIGWMFSYPQTKTSEPRSGEKPLCGLVLRAEEVVDGLDGVEGGEGNLYEDGVPVTHGAVPETGKFKGLELTPVLGLA